MMVDDDVQAFVVGAIRLSEEEPRFDFAPAGRTPGELSREGLWPAGGVDENRALRDSLLAAVDESVWDRLVRTEVLVFDTHYASPMNVEICEASGPRGIFWLPFLAFFGRSRSRKWMFCGPRVEV